MKSLSSRRKLFFESLENRTVLAGNVTAVLSGGDLIITGDAASNAISVESAGVNVIQVRGYSDGNSVATSINGTANGQAIFNNVTGRISISTLGSRDVVRVTNLVANGAVDISTGDGNDEVVTGRDTVTGSLRFGGTPTGPLYAASLTVNTGNQDDVVYQSDLHVTGNGVLILGNNDDSVQIARPAGSGQNVEYFGNFNVIPGGGDDTFNATGLIVDDNFTINDTSGAASVTLSSADIHGAMNVFTAEQIDQVALSATAVRGTLTINTFAGADSVSFNGVCGRLSVDSGTGNDSVRVNDSSIDSVFTQLGLDNDQLELNNLTTKSIDALGNTGNDTFYVRSTRSSDLSRFNGESGSDTFRDNPNTAPNSLSNFQLLSVETILHV